MKTKFQWRLTSVSSTLSAATETKTKQLAFFVAIMASLVATPLVYSTAAHGADAAVIQVKDGYYKTLVDFDFMRQNVDIPPKKGVMIIDSRPAARQYDPGH
ncbi:MAG: hypothetical protein Q8O34_00200, partial [Rhodocyclaceae bacterium]|nr:hypothetical protein [Rhodocyclaceae bacterium]